MASFMADLGARLVDNGYAILPIMPGSKKPGRFVGGAWRDYPGWTKHCVRPTTDHEIAIWSQWPDAGIGIASGTVAAVDIDVADGEMAVRIAALAQERLGDTPALRIGRAPKRLLVYRTETPFKGYKLSPIEVLCEGQQFVAYHIHPDTGRPYEWPEESLADIDIGLLPAITEAQTRAFAEEAYTLLPEMGRKYRTESNLRTNLYVVGIADSGSGKNHSREVITELIVEAGLGQYLGGNKIASGAGLLTAVHRQPAILFQIDEFGMFLSAAADRKRSPRHITDILDTMTELYTMAGTIFLGAEYANRDGKNERRDINQRSVFKGYAP